MVTVYQCDSIELILLPGSCIHLEMITRVKNNIYFWLFLTHLPRLRVQNKNTKKRNGVITLRGHKLEFHDNCVLKMKF